MSIDQLKEEVALLAPQEQRQLLAYLVALQTQGDDRFRGVLAQRIDDSDPAHWVDLDRLREKFSE